LADSELAAAAAQPPAGRPWWARSFLATRLKRDRPAVASPSAGVPQLYAWAWGLLVGSRWRIAAAAAFSLLVVQIVQFNAALLVHAFALLQGKAAAAASQQPGDFLGLMPSTLPMTALLFGVISIALFGLQFIDRFVTLAIDTVVIYQLQEKLHQKMLRVGSRYHASHNIGALQMLFTRYVSQSAGILRELLAFPVVNGISLVTASIYLWQNLAPLIGPGNVAIAPFIIGSLIGMPIIAWRVSRAMRVAIQTSIMADAAVGDELVNTLRRPIDMQLLGAQAWRNQAFAARTRFALAARLRSLRRSEFASEIQRGMPQLLQAGILVFAVAQFLRLSGTAEQFAVGAAIIAVLQFVPMILAPIQQTISFYNAATASVPPVVELVNALGAQEEVVEARNAVPINPTKGTISINDVQIDGPDADTPILKAVTHEFEGGKIWGLVGRSGCGKSTLLTTIARATDPSRGTICIDGVDVRQVQLASLRQAVSFMGQFPAFIDDTVRANLNLATAPASDETLLDACGRTALLPRLEELAAPASPLDLTIYAEPNKGALSGGERRLLAMARILAHPARIVLLDEPTAGVDAGMRGQLVDLIKQRFAGATVIVVDHDLQFIADVVDVVACMEHGTITASVPRAELLDRPSPFLDLWHAQRRMSGAAMTVTSFPAPVPS
jgi:ATP-binding cassette, subfamily B, bacterial